MATEKIYTYEEAYGASVNYFNGDELAARVFVDKYALRNNENELLEQTPEDMHWRLASEFARIEKDKFQNPLSKEEIYEYFKNFERIIPQGSPMYGIGNKYQYVSIGNCFVLPSPEDSYLGIMSTDTNITQISCRRGGIGFDISKLRPKNVSVKNAAKSTTGAIEFMKRFSNTIREVGQAGRRAAGLMSISVHHPEVLDFITCKQDLTQVTGANISVKFTDEFLHAVENDEDFELRWPVCKDDADNMKKSFPQISNKIKAKKIWEVFIDSTWKSSEPGAMFFDTVLRESTTAPYKEYGFIEESSNPCQPKWAKVLTPNGIKKLCDVNIGDLIWSKEGWTTITKKTSSGIKEVFKYQTTAGIFYGTKDHKLVIDKQNTKERAENCESIHIIKGPYTNITKHNTKLVMDGLVLGDGSIHKSSSNLIILYIGINDQDYFIDDVSNLITKHRPGIKEIAYEIETSITPDELPHTYKRKVPERFLTLSFDDTCSFLRGIYSANGSVCDNRITLKSASKSIIEDVQMLLSSVGIRSYWTKNKPTTVKFKNGKYKCKESYDLNITYDREKFVKNIGFIQQYKNDKISVVHSDKPEKEIFDIIYKDYLGKEEVFDITVDNNSHTYWSQCCDISNCGEQFLPRNTSCRLICLNLYSYVDNKFTDEAEFNTVKFVEDVKIMQRLADDMVDLEIESIQRIIQKIENDPEAPEIKAPGLKLWTDIVEYSKKDRRTGCGLTGLGDCIAALGMKYDSEEALLFAEQMQQKFKMASYESSIDMAEELGPFPLYNKNLDIKSDFIKRIKDENPELYKRMTKYGRRNMTLLTIAPTGSVSCLTQTSSGLEPVFMLSYMRRKKGNPGDKDFRTDFVDQSGDHWMHFEVLHKGLQDWQSITGKSKIEDSPYYKSQAHELDYLKRVELQGKIQRHIDNSISVTTNLPNDISKEEVSKIYLKAWKCGCKGMTIYRDGSRTGVLVKNEDKKSENPSISKTTAPVRPKTLPCDIHHTTIKGESYLVVIGLLDGEPYEVFASLNGTLDKKYKNGITKKEKRGIYRLYDLEDNVLVESLTGKYNEHEESITRLVSTSLRHGADTSFVVHQLEKSRGDIQSYGKVIARILKKYIPDDTEVKGEECPECGAKLYRMEGCLQCKSCPYSKCG